MSKFLLWQNCTQFGCERWHETRGQMAWLDHMERSGNYSFMIVDFELPDKNIVFTEMANPVNLAAREKEAIIRALEQNEWNQKESARILGISNRALNYKVRKYKINAPKDIAKPWHRNN